MADGSVTIDTKLNNDGFKSGLGKLGSIAKTGLKTVAVATGVVASTFAGIVTASVNARGEIEQLVGGAKKIFNVMEIGYPVVVYYSIEQPVGPQPTKSTSIG